MSAVRISQSAGSQLPELASSQRQVSPNGTVRTFRTSAARSRSLTEEGQKTLSASVKELPISLPAAAPSAPGDIYVVEDVPLQTWNRGPQNTMRPITYKPNGSFRTLRDMNKVPNTGGVSFTRSIAPVSQEKESHIPGYTGFIRGKQHIQGRTYGDVTRRALASDYRETACTSPIPSDPQANRKIRQRVEEDSFVSNTFGDKNYHIPGYTGFVPGVRGTFAKSYGSTTGQKLAEFSESNRSLGNSGTINRGFAETSRRRQKLQLESNPLPGAIRSNRPPEKLIPAHVKDLRFLAM